MVTMDASPSSPPTSCGLAFPANLLGCVPSGKLPSQMLRFLQSCENETSDLIGSEPPELNSKRGLAETVNQPLGHCLKLHFFWK